MESNIYPLVRGIAWIVPCYRKILSLRDSTQHENRGNLSHNLVRSTRIYKSVPKIPCLEILFNLAIIRLLNLFFKGDFNGII